MKREDIERRLTEFATLEPDWDSYGSEPITTVAIATAREVLTLTNRNPDHIAPVNGGGVLIEWSSVGSDWRDVEVWIGDGGELGYLEVKHVCREADDVPLETIASLLQVRRDT